MWLPLALFQHTPAKPVAGLGMYRFVARASPAGKLSSRSSAPFARATVSLACAACSAVAYSPQLKVVPFRRYSAWAQGVSRQAQGESRLAARRQTLAARGGRARLIALLLLRPADSAKARCWVDAARAAPRHLSGRVSLRTSLGEDGDVSLGAHSFHTCSAPRIESPSSKHSVRDEHAPRRARAREREKTLHYSVRLPGGPRHPVVWPGRSRAARRPALTRTRPDAMKSTSYYS